MKKFDKNKMIFLYKIEYRLFKFNTEELFIKISLNINDFFLLGLSYSADTLAGITRKIKPQV
jgi:hypothetical protein